MIFNYTITGMILFLAAVIASGAVAWLIWERGDDVPFIDVDDEIIKYEQLVDDESADTFEASYLRMLKGWTDDEFTEQEIKEILIAHKEMDAGNSLTEDELFEWMEESLLAQIENTPECEDWEKHLDEL